MLWVYCLCKHLSQGGNIYESRCLGFKYPKVDTSKCIECGLCKKICAFNDNYDKSLNLNEPVIYTARHKDIHEVETSRSDAAFIAISDYILEQEGIVYGVGYTDHFRVVHKRATKGERNKFKGNKYVQSDMNTVFRQIKKDLQDGLTVLFSGTPCQTSGLNSYVDKRLRENLYLVDIACQGVPSPYIWQDYISYTENKYKSKIVKVNFRDKSRIGWSGHIESFGFENRNKIESNIFTDLFYKHIMLRPSCGNCHYTNFKRPSDITLAHFWGWEKIDTSFNAYNKRCSLILLNTEKGYKLFEVVKDRMNTILANLEDCLQPNLQYPTTIHPKQIDLKKL